MIRCESISKTYACNTLFEDISFYIGAGEKTAFMGRNGSGKTTLFKMISGEEPCDSGTISIPANYRIGLLSQHAHFSRKTVLDEANSALNQAEAESEWKVKKILSGLGFSDEDLHKEVSSLSGGFTLRLQLAKLLLAEPDLLLLDEPTNYLDVRSVQWLSEFLNRWPKELLAISHDRAFLDAISTHTMGLHRGALLKIEGSTQDYFHILLEKEKAYTRTAQKRTKEREKLEDFIDRFGAKASKSGQANARKKQLLRLPELEELERIQSLSFSFHESPTHAKTLLEAIDISFSYSDKEPLFSNISCAIGPKDRIAVAGKNGAGKSTFLKVIKGELAAQSGRVQQHPSLSIGYFGQTNIERLRQENSPEEEISSANPSLSFEQVRTLMGIMMVPPNAKTISTLSGGEKARVLLAKILATPTNVLLLDEPTNHLDIESIEALASAIERFSGAVIIVSHSEMLLERLSTASLIFDGGTATYYPMNYGTFLQEIGWKNASSDDKKQELREDSTGRDDRQKRAIRVQERAKAIKPVKAQIEKIEAELIEAETRKSNDEAELISLVQAPVQSRQRVQELQKTIHMHGEKIDSLYSALEEAEAERQRIEKIYAL